MSVHFREKEEKLSYSMIITGIIIIGILMATLIAFLINFNKPEEKGEDAKVQTELGDINSYDDFEDVSMEIGKKVEETKNEINSNSIQNNKTNQNIENGTILENNTTKQNSVKETTVKLEDQEKETNNTSKDEEEKNENKEKNKEEIEFVAPIKGEILRKFAPDSLVYSNTLEEWVTHNGIDIKADKTSVVVSAAKGKVSSIKNDPRYGLTVIIDHDNGFQTVYSNLLTAEFVVDGEEVTEGQTIGTVGNSATFEIADDFHLHFEMLKNQEYVDPESYIK